MSLDAGTFGKSIASAKRRDGTQCQKAKLSESGRWRMERRDPTLCLGDLVHTRTIAPAGMAVCRLGYIYTRCEWASAHTSTTIVCTEGDEAYVSDIVHAA
jgi:hypothetical protein